MHGLRQRPFRDPQRPRSLGRQNVRPPRIEQHAKRTTAVQHDPNEQVPAVRLEGHVDRARPAGNASSACSTGGPNATPAKGSLNVSFCSRRFRRTSDRRAGPHVERDPDTLNLAMVGIHSVRVTSASLLYQPLDELGLDVIQNSRRAHLRERSSPRRFAPVRLGPFLVLDQRPRPVRIPERKPVAIRGIGREFQRRRGGLDSRAPPLFLGPTCLPSKPAAPENGPMR